MVVSSLDVEVPFEWIMPSVGLLSGGTSSGISSFFGVSSRGCNGTVGTGVVTS